MFIFISFFFCPLVLLRVIIIHVVFLVLLILLIIIFLLLPTRWEERTQKMPKTLLHFVGA